MNISPTQTAKNVSTLSQQSQAQSGSADMKDEFLTMLVAQIRNQDPLNPMDSAQFTSQLAQISTVQGIEKMQELQNQNNVLTDALQVLQTTDLIGKNVRIPSDVIELDQTEAVKGQVDLLGSAADVKVIARDANGEIVEEISLGQKDAGVHDFELPEMDKGAYSLEVVAINGEDSQSYTPFLQREIDEVTIPSDGSKDIYLDVNGIGTTSLYKIKSFLGESEV